MKTYFTLLMLFLASASYSQDLQYKHDIGLKLSSFESERFQLQYRYHLNEKWALSANAYFGKRSFYYSSGGYVIQDSIYQRNHTAYNCHSYGVELGAIRKLNFMKHNFYYVGGSIGFGGKTRTQHNTRVLYTPLEDDPALMYSQHPSIGEVIEDDYAASVDNSMNFKTQLFLGTDVPLIDRLSLNFELGMMMNVEAYSGVQFSYLEIAGYLSGGLRYRFGKQ